MKRLSVIQRVFYNTVLQTHKTLSSKKPKALYRSLSSDYPYRTRSTVAGHIRENIDVNKKGFKYRARQNYNMVPEDIRKGSIQTVKKNLKQWVKQNIPIDEKTTVFPC